jgi:hypothetical protein
MPLKHTCYPKNSKSIPRNEISADTSRRKEEKDMRGKREENKEIAAESSPP